MILVSFWEGQTIKNALKNVFENIFFFNDYFGAIFLNFLRFWPRFGRLWGLKKLKKNGKNGTTKFIFRFLTSKMRFEAIFDPFGWILDLLWSDF